MKIEAWVDVACPWCFVGKKRLEDAIASSGHSEEIELVLHTFELDPGAPKVAMSNPEYIGKAMGMPASKAIELEGQLRSLAAAEGLEFTSERMVARSVDALRLVHLAAEYGGSRAFFSTVQGGLFAGRTDVYTHEFLADAAESAGVPRARALAVLASAEYSDAVAADRAAAVALGARGVPFTTIDGRFGVPGVISTDAYRDAINSAFSGKVSR